MGRDAAVRERQGSGGWWLRSPRWESLRRKGVEKTGTAPSSGAGLMPAPPPPLATGAERPSQSRLFHPLPPKTLRTAPKSPPSPAPLPLTHYAFALSPQLFWVEEEKEKRKDSGIGNLNRQQTSSSLPPKTNSRFLLFFPAAGKASPWWGRGYGGVWKRGNAA